MIRQIVRGAAPFLARWGFAVLVGLAAVAAVCVAVEVDPPAEVPGFALQATPVYRLEVGGAVFAAVYVASLAFVLALGNRAFSELGPSGVRVQNLHDVTQDETIKRQDEALDNLIETVSELEAKVELARRLDAE